MHLRPGLRLVLAVLALLALSAGRASAQSADGKKIYDTNCAACHQSAGQGVPGMYPPVARSEWVVGDERLPIRMLLQGLTGEIEVNGEVYAGTMPPWGGALKDAEIAAVLTYIRSHWGNEAAAVSAATVARERRETAARKTPWTVEELVQSLAPRK